uniref:Uncharacterized protein n=1 Tax=Plectus sambesii TaxID=2011161 RepID=A0A914V9X7_9BILA
MQLILVISLCVVTAYAQSYANLRFTHPIMGELKVSTKNYPLLTPVENPLMMTPVNNPEILITPSTQQLSAIHRTVGRQPLDTTLQNRTRSFLFTEFGNNLTAPTLPAIDESQLPFKSLDIVSDFDIIQIPNGTYSQFMRFYQVKLRNNQRTAPWLPAQEMTNQLTMCPWVQSSGAQQDVRFDPAYGYAMSNSKTKCNNDPGTNTIIVVLSFYGGRATPVPVAKPTQITQEWNLIMDASKIAVITNTPLDRLLTAKQNQILLDFFQGSILRNVQDKFYLYLYNGVKTEC